MGRDNTPQIRQRAQLERKRSRRASYERILIVSEGSKTEPLYFCEIRSAKRLSTINVQVYASALGTQPSQVVEYAKQLFEEGDLNKGIRKRAFEKVFAVFDRDDHSTYFNALDQAQSLDKRMRNDLNQIVEFRAIASIPSFELWLLLHFEDIRHPLHRDDVMVRLKKYIPDYEKGGGGSYARTSKSLDTATSRAKLLKQRSNAFIDTEPYTDIHELVEILNGLG
jgi:hypothetical protein